MIAYKSQEADRVKGGDDHTKDLGDVGHKESREAVFSTVVWKAVEPLSLAFRYSLWA
jgi:hypothetical protein